MNDVRPTSPLLDLLFEDDAAGRCLVGADDRVVRVNGAWPLPPERARDDVLGAEAAELLPGRGAAALATLARARAGERVEIPAHPRPSAGQEAWWAGSVAPVALAGGTGLLLTLRRVGGERGPLLDELAHPPDAWFRLLSEAMPHIVCVLGPDGRVQYVNPAWTAYSGLDLAGSRRVSWPGVVHPDDLAAAVACLERTLSTGAPQDLELRYRGAAGTYRWFVCRLAPLVEGGRVRQLIGAGIDIDDRKNAERAVRESEGRLRLLVEHVPAAVAMFDREMRYLAVSRRFLTDYRLGDAPILGRSHYELFPEIPERWREIHRRCLAGAVERCAEEPFVRADGSVNWLRWEIVPWRDATCQVGGLILFSEDITEQKRSKAALEAMNSELVETDRRRTEFLAMLSHELRNPLAPIRNSSYLLDRVPPDSVQARRAKAVIHRQTDHLTRLVDDLLDVTRVARGKVELRRALLDLREVVRRTTDDLQDVFEHAGVALRVRDLGPDPIWVEGDATRLAQVLGNLLHNAVKFTARGGSVDVSLRRLGDRAELRVRDTGIGMDADMLARMFEPFTQAEQSLARTRGGLGLGLALVKGLVELHGGAVEGHSEGPGRGSEFVVRLPVSPAASVTRGASPTAPGGLRRIVVIEDNVDTAQTLAEVLALAGHEVRTAHDGHTGLAVVREVRPDVVLCDLGLPDLDGYEVARAIRAEAGPGVRLIALSGYAQPEDRDRAWAAGFDLHLAKPADVDEVLRAVAQGARDGGAPG